VVSAPFSATTAASQHDEGRAGVGHEIRRPAVHLGGNLEMAARIGFEPHLAAEAVCGRRLRHALLGHGRRLAVTRGESGFQIVEKVE
jgi:hypothetical protein